MDFNFPPRRGTGIARHLTHCSSDTVDLINQLCIYDPDHRISAAQALRHPYFDAVRCVIKTNFKSNISFVKLIELKKMYKLKNKE